MLKVVPIAITKELTLGQLNAHNDNYNALANKDKEAYDDILSRIACANTSIVVAGPDAPQKIRNSADYLCDGTHDQAMIQAAINSVASGQVADIKLVGSINIIGNPSVSNVAVTINKPNVTVDGRLSKITLSGAFAEEDTFNIFVVSADNCIIKNIHIDNACAAFYSTFAKLTGNGNTVQNVYLNGFAGYDTTIIWAIGNNNRVVDNFVNYFDESSASQLSIIIVSGNYNFISGNKLLSASVFTACSPILVLGNHNYVSNNIVDILENDTTIFVSGSNNLAVGNTTVNAPLSTSGQNNYTDLAIPIVTLSSATYVSIDANKSNVFELNLSMRCNILLQNMNSPTQMKQVLIRIKQNTANTIGFPTGVIWKDGIVPAIGSAGQVGNMFELIFTCCGDNKIYGSSKEFKV